jgi:hypothetical protein
VQEFVDADERSIAGPVELRPVPCGDNRERSGRGRATGEVGVDLDEQEGVKRGAVTAGVRRN